MLRTEKNGDIWFREELYNDTAQEFLVERVLLKTKSEFQTILILQTKRFGRVLVLDDVVQLTEFDEYIYHEAMAHITLSTAFNRGKILIIGGGDGGVLREVVKYQDAKEIHLVEIDSEVIKYSQEYLPSVSNGAFADKRVIVSTQSADLYVKKFVDYFDAIIVDAPDPATCAEVLFNASFYQDTFTALTTNGVAIYQSGSKLMQADEHIDIKRKLSKHFAKVQTVTIALPTYYGGDFCLSLAHKSDNQIRSFDPRIFYKQ
jgi:spermidine synthase